jgi:hypothetical protein
LLVCSGCVGVCACVERERGSPGPHARLAVARSPGKMTPRRPPASPPRCDRSWGEEEEAASSPIAGQLLMRLPAAGSVQCQAGLWRAREREREEGGREKGRVESRTDDVNLARCPRPTKSQCCSFRVQIPRALQGARGRSLRGLSASSRTSARRENCRVWQIVLCAQVAHAIAVIGVLLSNAEFEQPL